MKRLHVAAGVIRGANGHVLIAKRPMNKHQGGLWEFPGGKVEEGESAESALARELAEELGIAVTAARPLIQVHHDYPDKQVLLDVWEVLEFVGEPHGVEGQPLAWVAAEDLPHYDFPAANRPIIAASRLPKSYLITPESLAPHELLCGVASALDAGVRLLQLRCPSLPDTQYRALADQVLELSAGRAQVMLKGPLQWSHEFPGAGWHLTATQLRRHADAGRPIEPGRWLAASCHDVAELDLAKQMGVDFIVLSPILATASHPEAIPMGWQRAADLLLGFAQPAYLLGGLGPKDVARAAEIGAQGVAGIRAFWP